MKLLALASFAIFATSESKKHCAPCVKPSARPAKRPNPDCIKRKIVQTLPDSSTDSSIEGNSKTSSSFGNRENQDYVEINVQVATEYKDQFDTKTETTTEVEDCNCDCDCDKKEDEIPRGDSSRNAAAEVVNQVDTQYFETTGGSGEGNHDDTDDRSGLSGICESFDCPNPPCQIFCEAENGYYPDPRDCRNFCFCSGNIKVPSKFQRCAGGLVWDPSCGEEGCCNWPSDSSSDHCTLV